jgi:hypothetical protein
MCTCSILVCMYIRYYHTDLRTPLRMTWQFRVAHLYKHIHTDPDEISMSVKLEHTCLRCPIFARQIPVASPSKAYTAVYSSDTGNPTLAWMYVCFFLFYSLAICWPASRESYQMLVTYGTSEMEALDLIGHYCHRGNEHIVISCT